MELDSPWWLYTSGAAWTFFKIYFMFHWRKQVIQILNNMNVIEYLFLGEMFCSQPCILLYNRIADKAVNFCLWSGTQTCDATSSGYCNNHNVFIWLDLCMLISRKRCQKCIKILYKEFHHSLTTCSTSVKQAACLGVCGAVLCPVLRHATAAANMTRGLSLMREDLLP